MFKKSSFSDVIPRDALPFGLGCSRLGSVNGANGHEARELLEMALDCGVRFFDTSNIYGQGDSEKLLGAVLGRRDDVVVCSKAGKYLSWQKRTLVPLKGMMRRVARRSSAVRQGIAQTRSTPMPTCWDARFLSASIDASLRRLGRDNIEMFMLHSPSADVIAAGEAIGALDTAKQAGKIQLIGVSVDDIATAEAALADPRVRALQLPLRPGETEFDAVTARAAQAGVAVVAREILGGAAAISRAVDPTQFVQDRIIGMIRRPDVTLPLVGTIQMANLQASVAAARSA